MTNSAHPLAALEAWVGNGIPIAAVEALELPEGATADHDVDVVTVRAGDRVRYRATSSRGREIVIVEIVRRDAPR